MYRPVSRCPSCPSQRQRRIRIIIFMVIMSTLERSEAYAERSESLLKGVKTGLYKMFGSVRMAANAIKLKPHTVYQAPSPAQGLGDEFISNMARKIESCRRRT